MNEYAAIHHFITSKSTDRLTLKAKKELRIKETDLVLTGPSLARNQGTNNHYLSRIKQASSLKPIGSPKRTNTLNLNATGKQEIICISTRK
jgi:hypothetical protein